MAEALSVSEQAAARSMMLTPITVACARCSAKLTALYLTPADIADPVKDWIKEPQFLTLGPCPACLRAGTWQFVPTISEVLKR